MGNFKEKKDPRRLKNWGMRSRAEDGDEFDLVVVETGSSGAIERSVCHWPRSAIEDWEDWAEEGLEAAGDFTEECDARCKFEMRHKRKRKVIHTFDIRMKPPNEDQFSGDIEPSKDGQIQQQMRHSEAFARMTVRNQTEITEALLRQIDALQRDNDRLRDRIESLETERQSMLDMLPELVAQQAELDAQEKESPTQAIIKQLQPVLMQRLLAAQTNKAI